MSHIEKGQIRVRFQGWVRRKKREFIWRFLSSVENCKQLSLLIFDKL